MWAIGSSHVALRPPPLLLPFKSSFHAWSLEYAHENPNSLGVVDGFEAKPLCGSGVQAPPRRTPLTLAN
jgi:hypothetical protein